MGLITNCATYYSTTAGVGPGSNAHQVYVWCHMAHQHELQAEAGHGLPGWGQAPGLDLCSEESGMACHSISISLHCTTLYPLHGSLPRHRYVN